MKRGRSTFVAAAAAAVLVAGCGSRSPTTGPSPASAAESQSDHAMLDFARCMRANGVDIPDPVHRPGHSGLSLELPEGVGVIVKEALTNGRPAPAAYSTCQHYLARIIATKEAGARAVTQTVRLNLIRYAQCMRTHAIPMLDPTPDGNLNLGNVPGISSGFGRYSPQFHSADISCRHFLPPTVHDNGTGP